MTADLIRTVDAWADFMVACIHFWSEYEQDTRIG
jgi:hypothetical protein